VELIESTSTNRSALTSLFRAQKLTQRAATTIVAMMVHVTVCRDARLIANPVYEKGRNSDDQQHAVENALLPFSTHQRSFFEISLRMKLVGLHKIQLNLIAKAGNAQ
jgi:hypothetical protein